LYLFYLLATLSIVYSIPSKLRKRATIFEPCAGIPALEVTEIEPDPFIPGGIGKFHVSGTLTEVIPKGYMLAAGFFDLTTDDPPINPTICAPEGALDCPYPAKTPFAVILSGRVSFVLPPSYEVVVVIAGKMMIY
jgi:hypothetical protein